MENLELFWEEVKGQIKKTLPDHCYRMWIDPVELLEYDGRHVKLSSPNSYSMKRLKDNYLLLFKQEFSKLGRSDVEIEFFVKAGEKFKSTRTNDNSGFYPATSVKLKTPRQMSLPGMDVRFNNGRLLKKGFTFDDFVVGNNSDFAYSASLSLAHGKRNGSNILYLLARTGLGKSHLSQAVGHHILTHNLSRSVYYVTAEDFTNEMIYAIKTHTIDHFKEKYRKKCDVLILEDIHFLAGKDATQKELAITLDYLLEADKKIIFSGCELPDEIPKLNEQLKSRLTLGLITEISVPDYETRVRILKKKSKNLGCAIPREVTEYIAQELNDNVRQLESGLFGVAAKGQLMGYDIDLELAKSVITNLTNGKKRITVESIKKLICDEFSVSEADIVSKSRKKSIVKPRQIAIYLARKYTDQPIKKIGGSFNRYHATAIYAVNEIEKEIRNKSVLFEQIKYLSGKIESGRL